MPVFVVRMCLCLVPFTRIGQKKEDVRNCVHLISSYPLMKGIRPGMIPSSYETGSDETKKNRKCKAKLLDLLCGSFIGTLLYWCCFLFCFVFLIYVFLSHCCQSNCT